MIYHLVCLFPTKMMGIIQIHCGHCVGKMRTWALVLNYPISFVLGSVRCSLALCLFFNALSVFLIPSCADETFCRREWLGKSATVNDCFFLSERSVDPPPSPLVNCTLCCEGHLCNRRFLPDFSTLMNWHVNIMNTYYKKAMKPQTTQTVSYGNSNKYMDC